MIGMHSHDIDVSVSTPTLQERFLNFHALIIRKMSKYANLMYLHTDSAIFTCYVSLLVQHFLHDYKPKFESEGIIRRSTTWSRFHYVNLFQSRFAAQISPNREQRQEQNKSTQFQLINHLPIAYAIYKVIAKAEKDIRIIKQPTKMPF